ncbi:PilN domain-containing protein [Anaerobaca lacustris]|uniref:PilN domain-containing protein n=1 Tax=Anaerobaca lacustris TaxID=3044600 RepID=A0AAW6U1J7_9BACT|nr:PilN domain-containing protein [Sedimentisphaerales bacterium M17dextr]
MPNINFVPDDYVQSNESRRANLMCLVLFSVVMAALGGSFVTIKIRQRACGAEESLVNAKMVRMQESIKKFEELQTKRKEMMKTALTTAELIEPVPRSVVLASLTNTLPPGVSLVKLNVMQKEPAKGATRTRTTRGRYEAAQARNEADASGRFSAEEKLETHMDIEGMAPSDIQVADYIKRLSNSLLLDNVALVESAEKKVEDASFRHFKLKVTLAEEVHLTKEDVDEIRARAEHSVYQF